ncbi:GNAT family N-acetyltransferase [Streptomyces sp. Li-HN-5-11]|uniref:GNAT family N-acetyltransferase n=1 Tax=Streptomyces sp. Li-HN-5-11 TaxID=3075432 RepID=UPI0028B0D12C|nr:GNAT family N-acetyltransferase [Streptomyces sp. Li-HN-5-11]WNM32198.1 GNAT family N-acetyltransferase [Streptomyces sp. Li-HN-5-11]WOP39037.1 GNAT family N-acetyltransferase [Streptomyces sp. Li-HN-5-13]
MPVPVVLTGRMTRLEPLAPHHAEGLAQAGAEDRTSYAFTPVPHDLEAARGYIDRALAEQAAGRILPFAVVRAADGRVVGSTRFLELDYWQGPLVWPAVPGVPYGDPVTAIPDAAEIGNTWLAAHAQGTGINTEAKLLMLRHAFETWRVRRVAFRADARNLRSCAAIERLGATCEGIRRAHSRGLDGTVRSTAFYSVLDDEWPTVRAIIELRLAAGSPAAPAQEQDGPRPRPGDVDGRLVSA